MIVRAPGFEENNIAVTSDMILCAEDTVGSGLLGEIIAGASSLTIRGSMPLLPCFKK